MHAVDPDAKARRLDCKACKYCEGSAAGCQSRVWMSGRHCCEACTGDHDASDTA